MSLPFVPKQLTDSQIESALVTLQEEKRERAINSADPSALVDQAFNNGFNVLGDPVLPQDMGNGIMAITGIVKDTSSTRHKCHLYTVRLGDEEYWFWEDESPTHIVSESIKVGNVRQTVALHSLSSNALILQHSMNKKEGEPHERKGCIGYAIDQRMNDEGETISLELRKVTDTVIRQLPLPPDQRGY